MDFLRTAPLRFSWLVLFFGVLTNAQTNSPKAPPSDFFHLCRAIAPQKKISPAVCAEIHQKVLGGISSQEALTAVTPPQVGAENSPLDSKIQMIVFNDPNYLPGVAYCYFVFRHWVDPQKISPDDLALLSSGFSILNEELAEYDRWLSGSKDGQRCRTRIERESQVPITRLSESLNGKIALLALNPWASLYNGAHTTQALLEDLKVTLRHERIHAYQALCPALEKWGQEKWLALPQNEQLKFPKVYPHYNWADLKVAGREYVAFSYEKRSPKDVLDLLSHCPGLK